MKVSQFLRQWQILGQVPDGEHQRELAFWAGWLVGHARNGTARTFDEARELAIKAAEFIEDAR
jgi:hypothetical protein